MMRDPGIGSTKKRWTICTPNGPPFPVTQTVGRNAGENRFIPPFAPVSDRCPGHSAPQDAIGRLRGPQSMIQSLTHIQDQINEWTLNRTDYVYRQLLGLSEPLPVDALKRLHARMLIRRLCRAVHSRMYSRDFNSNRPIIDILSSDRALSPGSGVRDLSGSVPCARQGVECEHDTSRNQKHHLGYGRRRTVRVRHRPPHSVVNAVSFRNVVINHHRAVLIRTMCHCPPKTTVFCNASCAADRSRWPGFNRAAVVVTRPCCHQSMCQTCRSELLDQRCPIHDCQTPIESFRIAKPRGPAHARHVADTRCLRPGARCRHGIPHAGVSGPLRRDCVLQLQEAFIATEPQKRLVTVPMSSLDQARPPVCAGPLSGRHAARR